MPPIVFLALAANVVLVIVCLLVGGRLIRLSSRTGQLPEFLLGSSFVLSALAVLASVLEPMFRTETRGTVFDIASRWLIALAVGLILYLAWRIFRPEARWAPVLVVVGAALLAMSALATAHPPGLEAGGSNLLFWLGRIGLVLPYAWAAIDMPTRLALWSVGLALSAALYAWIAAVVAARWYFDVHLPILFSGFVFGLPIAVSFWLAFFPPKSWTLKTSEEVAP